uniref:Uncharacterized protein n=1 Tax=Seriola lalandi dorsalis TaxID=1841481 RepID=A0A3B4YC47_SERLL
MLNDIFPPLNVIIKCVKNLFCALLAFEEGFLSTSNYVGMRHQINEFWADLARGCLKCQSRNVIITLFEALGMHFICFCVTSSVETSSMES